MLGSRSDPVRRYVPRTFWEFIFTKKGSSAMMLSKEGVVELLVAILGRIIPWWSVVRGGVLIDDKPGRAMFVGRGGNSSIGGWDEMELVRLAID